MYIYQADVKDRREGRVKTTPFQLVLHEQLSLTANFTVIQWVHKVFFNLNPKTQRLTSHVLIFLIIFVIIVYNIIYLQFRQKMKLHNLFFF